MNLIQKLKAVYFIGIGGIGMSALARYFNQAGIYTAGYDRDESQLCQELTEEGIKVHYDDDVALIPNIFVQLKQEEILVVYTPAIPENHSELEFLRYQKYNIKKRSEVLGLICSNHKTIAIAGTHGKTTVSTITAHIFKSAEKNANAFLGGISKNLNSNLMLTEKPQTAEFAIAEADEFDRSFLQLFPQIALITAIDADHLDIYGDKNEIDKTFLQFIHQIDKEGTLVIKENLLNPVGNYPDHVYTYGFNDSSDFQITDLKTYGEKSEFTLKTPKGEIKNLEFSAPGKINAENAMGASAVSIISGVSEDELRSALKSYRGVKRRFEYVINTENIKVIDDYAHHPAELEAFITSVQKIYPNKKIAGIFQPHLYSRTQDFANEFAKSLDLLNSAYVLPIYPARELPIEGVNSEMLLAKMELREKLLLVNLTDVLVKEILKNDIILIMGAGDMTKISKKVKKFCKNT